MCKITWKIWVIFLSIISILLILLVVKLIHDKSNRDIAKIEATAYINNLEDELESKYYKYNSEIWENGEKSDEENNNFFQKVKIDVNLNHGWKIINSSSILGRKLKVIKNFESTYLLQENKLKTLQQNIKNISNIQQVQWKKFSRKNSLLPSLYQLPRTVYECEDTKIMSSTTWSQYLDAVGTEGMRREYISYIKLMNDEAGLHKYKSAIDYWTESIYEIPIKDFDTMISKIWSQLQPLYKEFHAHLRGELRFLWEIEGISPNGTIPPHFLDIFDTDDEFCSSLLEATRPYPTKRSLNITRELRRRRYTPKSMATFTDDFLSSLGFPLMTPEFWSESIFKKSTNNPPNCIPRILRLKKMDSLRMSICGETDEATLRIVNKLMVEGALSSALVNQSILIRKFSNSQVMDSIRDGLLKSMETQSYYRRMGLLEVYDEDLPSVLNILYKELFTLFPIITSSIVFHEWSSDVYRSKIKSNEYNNHFWKIRQKIQGVSPSKSRSSTGFDPGAYPNIIQNPSQNIRPLLSNVMKYEIFHALCLLANENTTFIPLQNNYNNTNFDKLRKLKNYQNCDLFGRSGLSEILNSNIQSISILPWSNTFQILKLGTIKSNSKSRIFNTLEPTGMLAYFSPLYDYLKETNKKRELFVGW